MISWGDLNKQGEESKIRSSKTSKRLFLGLAEPVGIYTIAEFLSQLVEKAVSDVVGFLVEAAAMEAVAESITSE